MFEVFLVVLATGLLQYPNPLIRGPGDTTIKNLLHDCRRSTDLWICQHEANGSSSKYIGWLVYGTLVKLVLTTVTFGCKVPSGVIIPALDAGALFGRLIGRTYILEPLSIVLFEFESSQNLREQNPPPSPPPALLSQLKSSTYKKQC